jgi:hypothetical protein
LVDVATTGSAIESGNDIPGRWLLSPLSCEAILAGLKANADATGAKP